MVNSRVRNSPARAQFNSAANSARDSVASARDSVRTFGTAAKSLARSQADMIVDEIKSLRDAMSKRVENQPMKSVLIAAGTGLVLGFLLRRR